MVVKSDAGESLAILFTPDADRDYLTGLAETLGLEMIEADLPKTLREQRLVLWQSPDGLALQQTGKGAPGPVIVDFVGGAVAHRRKFGGGKSQSIVKAVGVPDAGRQLSVLDATAGLGRDAFVLATMGCKVTLVERSPVVRALLADGLMRAQNDPEVGEIASRMTLIHGQSQDVMQDLLSQKSLFEEQTSLPEEQTPLSEQQTSLPEDQKFDVVYLDPMFPHRDKSAAVKKEMVVFQTLLGPDLDADALLEPALGLARHRVVVKRPKKAPDLAEQEPGYRLEGKSGRFDIYPLKSFSKP